ncbi:DEAD (Asp-Glu-Ala-Asp) box polypeptide 59 [Phytophthora pseudosyringae]|uniref:RNA helicase n=1 Tax=Phytophthora pseudosyringae TaxID=221518 RepID=A0A8T1VZS2_9STRA|nr:DEAD (Asp-Glu-Ala-Asp) box polypeptide 59 [Phytophthora pseudosyringae]
MADTSSVVKHSAAQRQPQPGEPVCAICGRYGEFVCDATDEDVCSLECRDVCIARRQPRVQEDAQQAERSDELRRQLGIQISSGSASKTGPSEKGAQRWPVPFVDFAQEQESVQLPKQLLTNLSANGFERPTPVQMQTVPCVLKEHNVLVSAPTGTGKTASYLIPAIAQVLLAREEEKEEVLALVLAPVRELAIQIETVAKRLMRGIENMKTALLVGGFPVPTQRYRLQGGVQLIVATPGRFLDIFTNYSGGDAILPAVRICVVDEVDIMLDVGFRSQISQIVASVVALAGGRPKGMQMLFFSATVSEEVEALVRQILRATKSEQAYIRIDVCGVESKAGMSSFTLNPSVEQQVRWSENKAKKNELFEFLKGKSEESTLIFVGSKIGATMLAQAIEKRCGIGAVAIHADKTQQERLRLLESFVNLEAPVLVSTNLLSRGMDLLNVENVVVYDFPKKIADYVHLVGRTGRGDDSFGNALTFVNEEDHSLFRELVPLLRKAKVSVPREVYQSIQLENAKQRARSSEIVIDESRRAFRIRETLMDELGTIASEWKEWGCHNNKRRRTDRDHWSTA